MMKKQITEKDRIERINLRIDHIHNILSPDVSLYDGLEKIYAGLCRKATNAKEGGEIKIWRDGKRSALFSKSTNALKVSAVSCSLISYAL